MQHNPELNVQIPRGAPASAIPRRTIQWMINAWRNLSVINGRLIVNGDRVTIECDADKLPDWSFRVRKGSDGLIVSRGFRCVIDTDWLEVEETALPSATGDGVVYMTRTYPILDASGNVTTQGYWTGPTFGNPPENNTARHTVRIASVTDDVIFHEHIGNISVTDWGDCP